MKTEGRYVNYDDHQRVVAALRQLWGLWNDKEWCKYQADYLRGHLSYAGMLEEKERSICAVIERLAAKDRDTPTERRLTQ